MKFVDEAVIQIIAGNGGNGCLSFRREKFVPLGGPDGGDGGSGGSVYLRGKADLNTLVDFRYQRLHEAKNGEAGGARQCSGLSADDLFIDVPIGTVVYDTETEELLGDITEDQQVLLVAKGGRGGIGNTRFKSSTNRAPRRTIPGQLGEKRELQLELKLLADVGLLGLPNAGKSTLIRAVSAARPKVADYPFTTLYPNLGVVRVADQRSFVIADIPGLIEGASEGAGLGVQFLKHLSRTSLLLHLVDMAPYDESDPVQAVNTITRELERFSQELAEKPRWLILNKMDQMDPDEVEKRRDEIVKKLSWQGPIYVISAMKKMGTEQLCYDLMEAISGEPEEEI